MDVETEELKYPKVCSSLWPRLGVGATRTAPCEPVLQVEPAKTFIPFYCPLILLECKLVNYLSGCWQQNPKHLFPEKSHFFKNKSGHLSFSRNSREVPETVGNILRVQVAPSKKNSWGWDGVWATWWVWQEGSHVEEGQAVSSLRDEVNLSVSVRPQCDS